MLKIISWNVNGVRAGIKKGMWDSVAQMNPSVFAIQETKSDESIMKQKQVQHDDFRLDFHSCSMKKGYSGVATYSRVSQSDGVFSANSHSPLTVTDSLQGIGDDVFDVEGRMITTKYSYVKENREEFQFTLLNGYYPQGGRGVERIEYKIAFYNKVYAIAAQLREAGEHVLLCGDFNTTVGDIDLARPKENKNVTGCLPEEREALDLFLQNGFVDTFRYFYPDQPHRYSYWDQITRARARNVGWRIDYVLADEPLLEYIEDAFILDSVMGSDHCPVGVTFRF